MMWGYGFGWFGWLVMAAWWVLVLAGIVRLARWLGARRDEGSSSARRLLDERFASGELSVEEYEERRRVLR